MFDFDVPEQSLEEYAFSLRKALSDGRWHLSKDLLMENRMLRHLSESMPIMFMSDQRGYKLVKFATDAEIESSVHQLESKAKHIQRHATALKAVLDKR